MVYTGRCETTVISMGGGFFVLRTQLHTINQNNGHVLGNDPLPIGLGEIRTLLSFRNTAR